MRAKESLSMPKLDFMLLADYVRQDSDGAVHIMNAGFDTITPPQVPWAHAAHIAIKLSFGTEDVPGTPHTLRLILNGDDRQLAAVGASMISPPPPDGVPVHWRTKVLLNLSLMLPLPAYGDYALELVIDEEPVGESLNFRVVRPPETGGS